MHLSRHHGLGHPGRCCLGGSRIRGYVILRRRPKEALLRSGKPEILNTDQALVHQRRLHGVLNSWGAKISMDGRGLATTNIFVECRWRTVKYECIHSTL